MSPEWKGLFLPALRLDRLAGTSITVQEVNALPLEAVKAFIDRLTWEIEAIEKDLSDRGGAADPEWKKRARYSMNLRHAYLRLAQQREADLTEPGR